MIRSCAMRVVALSFFLLAAHFSSADIIQQRDGRKLTGTIVKEDPNNITIEGTYGQIVVPRTKIVSVTREKLSQIQLYASQLEKYGPSEPLRKAINDLREGPLNEAEQQAYRSLVASYQARLAPAGPTPQELAALDSQAVIEAQKLFDSMQITKGVERLKEELSQRPGQPQCIGLLCKEVIEECSSDECTLVLNFLGDLKQRAGDDRNAQAALAQGINTIEKHFADLEEKEAARIAAQEKVLAALPTPKPLPTQTPLPLITPAVPVQPLPSLDAATSEPEEEFPVGLDPDTPVEVATETDDYEYDEEDESWDPSGFGISSAPMVTQVFYWIGYVICFVAGVWLLFLMFSESILWGLGGMFVPFVSLIFTFTHWEDAKFPFFIGIGGGVVMVLGIVLGFL